MPFCLDPVFGSMPFWLGPYWLGGTTNLWSRRLIRYEFPPKKKIPDPEGNLRDGDAVYHPRTYGQRIC